MTARSGRLAVASVCDWALRAASRIFRVPDFGSGRLGRDPRKGCPPGGTRSAAPAARHAQRSEHGAGGMAASAAGQPGREAMRPERHRSRPQDRHQPRKRQAEKPSTWTRERPPRHEREDRTDRSATASRRSESGTRISERGADERRSRNATRRQQCIARIGARSARGPKGRDAATGGERRQHGSEATMRRSLTRTRRRAEAGRSEGAASEPGVKRRTRCR